MRQRSLELIIEGKLIEFDERLFRPSMRPSDSEITEIMNSESPLRLNIPLHVKYIKSLGEVRFKVLRLSSRFMSLAEQG